LVFALIHIS